MDPEATPRSKLQLSGDAPIEQAGEDRLQRAGFARAVADDIRQAPRDHGFVIAVTAPWGNGKTSVLRLVEEDLGEGDVTTVVRFNPWLFSGTEQLVEHFFSEISGQLESARGKGIRLVAKGLRGYGRAVSPIRLAPIVGSVAQASGEAAAGVGLLLEGGDESASQQAAKLQDRLKKLHKPIVVMVDDLDRLRDQEIEDVVRLVRLVGDFPNLVYVLAFDRPVVELTLGGGDDRARGRAYLDKIVHVSHELPLLRFEAITDVLKEAVQEVIEDLSEYGFEQEQLRPMLWKQVRNLFSTVRDIRRFGNSIRATLRLVGREVNTTDVLALEALRLFEPECFEQVVAARQLLTERPREYNAGTEKEKTARETIRDIPCKARPDHEADVRSLLTNLFPMAERHFDGSHYDSSAFETWEEERRVAVIESFSVYLHRSLPQGDIGIHEIESTISILDDGEALAAALDELDEGHVERLVMRLVENIDEISLHSPEVAVTLFIRRLSRMKGGSRDFLGLLPELAFSSLVHELLSGYSPERLVSFVESAEVDLSGRSVLLDAVGDHVMGDDLIEASEVERLRAEIAERVISGDADALAQERSLDRLLNLAARANPTRLPVRLKQWIRNDRFFVALVQSMKIEGASRLQLDWPALLRFVDLSDLESRSKEIDAAWVEAEFDDGAPALWNQLLSYIANPSLAEEDMRLHERSQRYDSVP